MDGRSIFERYFYKEDFFDRNIEDDEESIDVIMPIRNTNELFEKNLFSIYREIPIKNLIIGDAGCTDNSINILNKFPRVKIIDQTKIRTLGYSIAELISKVETEWFVYLHGDVFLPNNWYDSMKKYQSRYDWFECDRRMTIMIEYDPEIKDSPRAYSGSQMGRKEVFDDIIDTIDDDYLYRNEDLVYQELPLSKGFKYGRVLDTFHYHQVMNKQGDREPKFSNVIIKKFKDKQWEIDMYIKQVKGLIKYSNPKPHLIKAVNEPIKILKSYNALNLIEFKNWVKETNKEWLKYIIFKDSIQTRVLKKFLSLFRPLINKFFI